MRSLPAGQAGRNKEKNAIGNGWPTLSTVTYCHDTNLSCARHRGLATTAFKTASREAGKLLQLKIELADIHPAVWRRVVVPDTITLAALLKVIQIE